jgi:hypothetical protein
MSTAGMAGGLAAASMIRFIRHLLRLNVVAHFTDRTATQSPFPGAYKIISAIAVATGYRVELPPEIEVTIYDDRGPRYLWRPFEVRYFGGGWKRLSFDEVEVALGYQQRELEAQIARARYRGLRRSVMRALGMPAGSCDHV